MVHQDPDDETFFAYMVSDLDLQSFVAGPTDNCYPLSVEIVGTDVGSGRLNRQHTTYIIHVDDCGKIYERRRRYKEFKWLHKDLIRRGLVLTQGMPAIPSVNSRSTNETTSTSSTFTSRVSRLSSMWSSDQSGLLATLPPKKRFGNKRSDFVEERQRLLESYLKSLLDVEAVVKDKEIWRFLGVDPSTAVVVRFTRFPITAENALDKLEKLERIAEEELSLFRLCSRPVVWTLVRFARQICRLPLQADAARHLLRICRIMGPLLSHSYGRDGLVEAGAVSVLVAAMRRAVEDPAEAIKCGCAPAPSDVRKDLLRDTMTCTRRLIEETRGSKNPALIHFLDAEDGLHDIQRLAATDSPRPLRRAASMLIWGGLEDESTALLFFREDGSDSSAASMPPLWMIIADLLRSSDICTCSLAACCVAQLARHSLSPLRSGNHCGREEFEEALQVVASIQGRFDDIVSNAEATSACEGTDVHLPLLDVLSFICNHKGVPRLKQILERGGHQIDEVAAFVITVIEHFVLQHQKEESVLKTVAALALHLRHLVDNIYSWDELGAEHGDAATRISRILLHVSTAPDTVDAASLEHFKLRAQGLLTLYQDAHARTSSSLSRFESLVAVSNERRDAIEAQGLLERLCVKTSDTSAMGKQIRELCVERDALHAIKQNAEDLNNSAADRLKESTTVYNGLESHRIELLQRIEALSPNEIELEEAQAELEVSESRAQEESRAVEVQQEAMREADTCVQAAARVESDARRRSVEAQQAEIAAANACMNAPAELETIREQLEENEVRQAKITADASKLDAKKEESDSHIEALTSGHEQATKALEEIESVLEDLRQLRRQHNGSTTPRSFCADNEDDPPSECGESELVQLETRLRSHRPHRMTWPSEWGGGQRGPTDAPDWGPILEERPLDEGIAKVPPNFRTIGRYAGELQQLWTQERLWLDGERERAKKTLRNIMKTIEANNNKSRDNAAKALQLRFKADEYQDIEAMNAKHAEARQLVATTAEEAVLAKERLAEAELVSRLATQRFSQAHEKLQCAEAAVSNAQGQVWAAKSRASKARAALESWTSDLEKRTCGHLQVLADDVLHLRAVSMANSRTGVALGSEAATRQEVRRRAQELAKRLQDLDLQLSAEIGDQRYMETIDENEID